MATSATNKKTNFESLAVRLIGSWLFISGLISIVSAIVEVQEASRASVLYIGSSTALLSQHGILTGITLLYISRHLWRGERRAWQIALLLISLEVIKYALVTPHAILFLLYALTATIMIWCRNWFERRSDNLQIQKRLKQFLLVTLAVVASLLASIILLELKQHRGLTNTGINVALFLRHLLGIDIENNIGPLGRRLLGQVVNVAGLGLLCALLAALFRPHTAPARYPTDLERDEVTNLLDKYGLSSEDFFKLWPQPKRYFWDGARTTVIAYEVKRSVAFVLGNPVGPDAEGQERVINDFVSYCRSHGWRACFILIQEAQKEAYHSSDLKLFRIGATAFVDIEQFADKTSRNKWWRWVLNKTARQNLHYELAAPPHSAELLNKVKSVSDAWIKRSGHSERGFAMGYFDQNYLQACRLHLLKQADEVVAFANELPGFHNNPTVTIDLMRYQPSVDHAMPTLLADIIQQLHSENSKQYFDLGFVPLAGDSSKSEQVIKKLNQFFIRETIPASGLEQFKNKFDPEWESTYVAFDGDWLDLVHVSRWLDKLLRPPKAGL